MAQMGVKARQRQVFNSVFEKYTVAVSEPTPKSTPNTGFTAPGQPFGGFRGTGNQHLVTRSADYQPPSDTRSDSSRHVQDQVTWDRSWHVVTSWLSFQDEPFSPYGQEIHSAEKASPPLKYGTALLDVLTPETRLPYAAHHEDLVKWLSQSMRSHFFRTVQPWLENAVTGFGHEELLQRTLQVLVQAQSLYLDKVTEIEKTLSHRSSSLPESFKGGFHRDFQALVRKSVPDSVWETVEWYVNREIPIVLAVPRVVDGTRVSPDKMEQEDARTKLLALAQALHNVGLGGEKFQIMFAEAMNTSMSTYVYGTYQRVWKDEPSPPTLAEVTKRRKSQHFRSSLVGPSSLSTEEEPLVPRVVNHSKPSRCVTDLCAWTENEYARLAVEILSQLDSTEVAYSDLEKWKEMAIGRLASLRTSELFDIVVHWPNGGGAIDDLRTAITTPQRRLQLTEAFTVELKERLLHPGKSTLEILRTYIAMICSFHALDHSKVLLDRVAYPLQVYLCSREDTVRIIITGLLADKDVEKGKPSSSNGDKLVELAYLLNSGVDSTQGPDDDMDWNDMEWVPDPVDAGPGYKRRKNVDIIGTLIGVLGSQDVFIKEFQSIIGDNLLKNDGDFDREIKVLELLKTRFGESSLQSCEVMIKDIQDSRRLNSAIRRAQKLDPSAEEITTASLHTLRTAQDDMSPEGLLKPSLHAKILSRLFWPQLQDETYKVPDPIAHLQQRYEAGFESLKNARKLAWLHALGHATVDIELEDRTITEVVHTYQAAVIWAFQGAPQGAEPVSRSFEYLAEHLQMDDGLLRSALAFWVGKMVLHSPRPDEFAVLETLNPAERQRSDAAAAAAAAGGSTDDGPARGSQVEDKMAMYWKFIQGMLKNSAAKMPLAQIGMMLKMLIVEGFPYSNEELAEYLSTKVAAGELELAGGKYRLVKK
ncbi:hypothetical protein VE01_08136 [Pseudogymnoascus verrucosus]|uniref:Anaphase-promoting complex subunit 2 n=1 Tax=Pseudogymnoascus verrucosus TaxID=342668 RepID=A0A1B8GD68_9PEZI|nr:uncharacterized protein VE01_08136 [Pseudogymnoascus verrucosus]OBT93762.1 hypothetical protein VE01_08136 [Pseudogymnoascus verrucosus]